MDDDARLFEIFMDVQRGLPRQGPGCDDSTLQALGLCADLPARPAVLDIGCGPGLQTLVLAKALACSITAVDLQREYLEQLKAGAEAADVADRIDTLGADMSALPVAPESYDLIWAEGSAYIMGFEKAFAAWRRFLKPGGSIAVTELVWLRSDPPAEVAQFFGEAYPAMSEVDSNLARIGERGYEVLGHFTLPDRAWWQHYYTPLEAKLPALREKYAGDTAALGVIEIAEREIDLRHRFADCYGYEFFVARKPGQA